MTYLPDEEFYAIYGKVPRLTLDIVLRNENGVLMSLRNIEPYFDYWHLPGGTVYKDETVPQATIRIAKRETGLDVTYVKTLGHMEFPDEIRQGVNIHTISIVVEAKVEGGDLAHDETAQDVAWFTDIPENTIEQHKLFLKPNL
jgi:ADP-ribose pyrophosphatase YjhB (NUDIX family)